jgi:hypothetical protein
VQQEGRPDRHRFRDQPYKPDQRNLSGIGSGNEDEKTGTRMSKPDADEQVAHHRGQAKQVTSKGIILQNQ